MSITRILLIAVFAIIYFAPSTYTQNHNYRQNLAKEQYKHLRLLPRYENNNFVYGRGLDSVTRFDFTVKLRDGVILDGLKYIPEGTPPAGGWPTVIFVHGYGDNKETLAGFAKAQAQYGYYTTTFSMRGQGNSTGLSNLISSIEAQDMIEFVASVKSDSTNGSDPDNILIMGGSQGGLVPYHACALGMNVKTIISALAPPDFATSWIENGSIKMSFLWTVEYTPDTARYSPVVERMSDWVYSNQKQYWDSLAFWLPQGRDFLPIVQNNQIPLIMEGSWQDKFFNGSGIMKAADLNTNSPFKLYLGAVQGHGGDNSPPEDQWHMQFFNDWFLYWLFGQQNGVLDRMKYDYASTTYPENGLFWTFVHDSSAVPFSQITTNTRLYFNDIGKLLPIPYLSATLRNPLENRVTGGLTMQEAVNEEFAGSVFESKFSKDSISYTTKTLQNDVEWLGTPRINLEYSSSADTFVQFNFQVYELLTDGSQKLVNRINFTDRNYVKDTRRVRSFEGQAHSHIFKAGHRIKIVVTNLDTAPDDRWFLGTNPFVLPVLNNGTNYLYHGSNTYIDLPIKGGMQLFAEDSEERGTNPVSYSLSQNYPNPFNPVTTIKYSLADKNLVSVKIFDILGREVKTLVNEIKDAGNYELSFDASQFSSGVYFYSIRSGGFTDTKKMLLVK